METRELWKVLVPTHSNEGEKFDKKYHWEWDEKISQITGGVTVYTPVKGTWASNISLMKESLIPVEVACKRENIPEIMEATKKHYGQEAVMMYKVSDEVIVG